MKKGFGYSVLVFLECVRQGPWWAEVAAVAHRSATPAASARVPGLVILPSVELVPSTRCLYIIDIFNILLTSGFVVICMRNWKPLSI